ncbi:hypothetical protein [Demequina subtropica]|uniref:hypothetical protein n=1 Tax=Demequina subtropica TaxID=1638989 RepID=UPI0007844310|nr:hypothetical protein [Demequina subtropica]
MTVLSPAVDAGPAQPGDGLRAWARPVGIGLAVLVPAAALAFVHPAASLIVLAPAAAVGWRLHGSGLEPWRPARPDRFPDSVTDPRLRSYARDLRWRWEHAMVVGGLGAYDAGGAYSGPVLTAVSQDGDRVIAHARPTAADAAPAAGAAAPGLTAGLEAQDVLVRRSDEVALELSIAVRDLGEGWT